MEKIYDIIKEHPLWAGINEDEFEQMSGCIETRIQRYQKGEIVMLAGGRIKDVGMILSGGVSILHGDADGHTAIVALLAVPDLFGEVFACAGIDRSPVTVQANEESKVLFAHYRKMISACSSACGFHAKLIENMLKLIASKNLMLNQKIEILSKRTTREKLLAFFDAERGSARKFTVPYNREELANYLCVDRSAMSGELGKMRDEGLIRFHKNEFEILG